MSELFSNRPKALADYVAVIRRRKRIVILLPVVAAASAFFVAEGQKPSYQATAQVLVNRSNIASAITSVDPTSAYDPNRYLATVADVARSPVLAAEVVSAAGVPGISADQLLAASSITADPAADILNVSVSSPNPASAVRLTNTYAQEFGRYKTQLDTQKLDAALQTLQARTKSLRAQGGAKSPSMTTLQQYQTQLETIRTLLANSITVLKPAQSATKVHPRPKHTAILGALLGGVLGLGLAFLIEAFDRGVRSEKEIEEVLGVPLLARVPAPPRRLRETSRLVMVSEPGNVHAEAFRKLKTSIDFLDVDHHVRTIMVTSAVPREGKSTTIANLAVAFARSGRRVALVDLDLRQPFLHSFFRGDRRGITDVVGGGVTLDAALRPHFLPAPTTFGPARSRNGGSPRRSSAADVRKGDKRSILSVLSSGTKAPMGGDALADLLESEQLGVVLKQLGEQFELVLADTPPILAAGDALALTPRVDAILLVLHSGIQRPILHELARQLQNSQAPVIGFILTGVAEDEAYGYGYGYGYGSYGEDIQTRTERGAERV